MHIPSGVFMPFYIVSFIMLAFQYFRINPSGACSISTSALMVAAVVLDVRRGVPRKPERSLSWCFSSSPCSGWASRSACSVICRRPGIEPCRPVSPPSSCATRIPPRPTGAAHLRALRIVHRDLSDVPAARRRTRQSARPHLPDQGHAGDRAACHRGGGAPHRSLSVVPCLHDHMSLRRELHAPGGSRAQLHRADLSPAVA